MEADGLVDAEGHGVRRAGPRSAPSRRRSDSARASSTARASGAASGGNPRARAGRRRARAAPMRSICSIVPYSSSSPWIASTGQRDARQVFLDVPVAEGRVRARCRSSPGTPNRRRRDSARASRAGRSSRTRPSPPRCSRSRGPRPARAAPSSRRRPRGRAAAPAWISAIDAAVAVADEDRALDRRARRGARAARRAPRRACSATLAVRRQRRRAAVPVARVDDDVAAGRVRERLGKVAPHRDRAQPLVQDHDRRGRVRGADVDRARPRGAAPRRRRTACRPPQTPRCRCSDVRSARAGRAVALEHDAPLDQDRRCDRRSRVTRA